MLGVYVNDYSALLDACVLAPMPSCDSLLHLAEAGFSRLAGRTIFWLRSACSWRREERLESKSIIGSNRWPRHLKMRASTDTTTLFRLAAPDPGDQHVLAAAVKARVNVIVTQNLKDFPDDCLAHYDIAVQSLDHFMTDQYHLDPDLFINTLKRQSELRKIEFSQLISNLSKEAPNLGKLIRV